MRPTEPPVREWRGGGATSAILVHPGAVPVSHYETLVSSLHGDVSLHIVDLEQFGDYVHAALSSESSLTIEKLAVRVRDALDEHDLPDRSSWLLGGWSFGGAVAHALLQALPEHRRPERLLLLDSIAPVDGYTRPDHALAPDLVLPWFAMYLSAKRGVRVEAPAVDGSHDLADGLEQVRRNSIAGGALPADTSLAGVEKVYRAFLGGLARNNRLSRGHRVGAVDVPVTLVRPSRSLLDTAEPLGWEEVTSAVATVPCPGDHYSMLHDREAVAVLSRLIDNRGKPVDTSKTTG